MVAKFLMYDLNEYIEHTHTQILLKFSWSLTVWKAQGSTFNKKYFIDLVKQEAEHGLTHIVLSSLKKLSQIALISAIIGTRMNSLSNNAKIGPCVEHEADFLRTNILTKERLHRIIGNM